MLRVCWTWLEGAVGYGRCWQNALKDEENGTMGQLVIKVVTGWCGECVGHL